MRRPLAVEEICSAGPGGSYVDSDHTKKFAACQWQPTLMDRQNYEDWAAQGKKTMKDRVHQQDPGHHRKF